MKRCPHCHLELEQALLSGVEIDYCPRCYGLWFEEQELDSAKDAKDRDLRWLDIDLWKHEERFQVARGQKICPADRMPLYEVRYGDSNVRLDVCNICQGIWLDRGEFIEIIEYLRQRGEYDLMHRYLKNFLGEAWEVFSGPEMLRDELLDFLAILKLLQYKFAVQYPAITKLLLALPR